MTTLPVLSNAALIGTAARPLRASALPRLLECSGSVLLTEEFWGMVYDTGEDSSGPAAATGTLVHKAAEAFHLSGGDYKAGTDAIAVAVCDFPSGDPIRAARIFTKYAQDPVNQKAKIIKLEQKITYSIPPAPFDPTGEPIVVNGTLDQIREEDDGPALWDIKTGKTFTGLRALNHYAAQQALYTLAAGCNPGGLICTEGYFNGERVFQRYKCSLDDFRQLLDMVAVKVALARMGKLSRTPGDWCQWCPHKKFENCSRYVKGHVS